MMDSYHARQPRIVAAKRMPGVQGREPQVFYSKGYFPLRQLFAGVIWRNPTPWLLFTRRNGAVFRRDRQSISEEA
jgi:hypothetical protein